MKSPWTEAYFLPALRRRHAGPGRTVDGGGCCFFLLYYGSAGQLGRELAFLAGGLAIAVAGGLALRQLKALQPQEIPQ